jgi:uncharacterized protein YhfF
MDLSKVKEKYPNSTTFTFGDNKELCDQLLFLVRSGNKTATCEALRVFELGKVEMPKVGRIDIALNWDGTPSLAIKTIEITVKKFIEVGEEFALAEGENESLEGWREDHRAYFERNIGFDPEMLLVCERFEVIEVY